MVTSCGADGIRAGSRRLEGREVEGSRGRGAVGGKTVWKEKVVSLQITCLAMKRRPEEISRHL